MSWELTRFVLSLRNLTPTEKAVAHSLACHAPKHGTAYPSMHTIALEAGLGSRRAAQMVMRRLESKGVISPTSSKGGGRKNPTHYRFNIENSMPVDALSETGNSESPFALCGNENSAYGCTKTDETANTDARNSESPFARDSSRDKEAVDSSESATTVSQEQMEREVQGAWNYYLEKFDKQEIISPSAKKVGVTVLTKLRRRHPGITSEQCMDAMTGAIDRARYLVKRQPAKGFFAKWHAIFGKFETFYSLWEECHEVR